MIDRRKHPRRETSIDADLFLPGVNPAILPCRILDISEGGARVQLGFPYCLPGRIFLMMDDGETLYECETIWEREQMAGLIFLDRCVAAQKQELMEEIAAAEVFESASTARGAPFRP